MFTPTPVEMPGDGSAPGGVLALRPCGVCAKYVHAELGCKHWRPDTAPRRGSAARNKAYLERRRELERQRRRDARQVELKRREEIQQQAAADMARFRRQMGIEDEKLGPGGRPVTP